MTYILHIITRERWEAAQHEPEYYGESLAAEGFLHFSTPAQVVGVADARFRGAQNLQLLVVDAARLTAPLRYEAPFKSTRAHEVGQLFPHLYGPLNRDAVIAVVDFPPRADGNFDLPVLPPA
jgi:uncharacterized protein (DUF952 family)